MDITGGALRHPISIIVAISAILLASFQGIQKMPRDILPTLDIPVIYVAQPYGGLDPSQMESYVTYFYEYHFLYLSGIEHVESRNIQSTAIIKLQFHPGTDMAQAMGETVAEVARSRATMPEGTVPPFIIRFDEGSEPVGKLVFSSETRSLGELQNYALNFVRPIFATLEGVSAPPPFGASARTIVIEVDPKKLKERDLSADQVANSIVQANTVVASGNIHLGTKYPIVPLNSVVKDVHELLDVPLRLGKYPTTYLKDVAKVIDSTDLPTGYALVNGRRTVYIPVTKRAEASTLAVVDLVKENIPRFQAAVPDDVKVSYEFDQSGSVRAAIGSLLFEALLGAILTGLMVFLFLRDLRSVLIVVVNIPLALLSAVLALWISKQTVNIMTLGGLALAVGILVDDTTVTIENIHSNLGKGLSTANAALRGSQEIFKPALVTLLCILSVFIPSFFMTGVAHSLFVPLTLAVGFSMVGSFCLSRTLVPILATWFLKPSKVTSHEEHRGPFTVIRERYKKLLAMGLRHSGKLIFLYLVTTLLFVGFGATRIQRDIFPQVPTEQLQLRIKAPTGTSIENTEAITKDILHIVETEWDGTGSIEQSVAFVGTQPPNYPINAVYLWTSGPHEAVLEIALKKHGRRALRGFREHLREVLKARHPELEISFEPSSLVDRVMSMGSATPIEIAVNGIDLKKDREFAERIRIAIQDLPYLKDLQYGQRFDFPTVEVNIDRKEAGIKGLTVRQIGQSVVPATSSSRFLVQNFWADPNNGVNYQVQIEVPGKDMNSIEALSQIPVQAMNGDAVALGKFAKLKETTRIGEYDRYNMQRMVTLTANLRDMDLGHAASEIRDRIEPLFKDKPRGTDVHIRGQIAALDQIMEGLGIGLGIAILAIFLLLAASFESFRLTFVVLSALPAVLAGVLGILFLWQTSLNIESFMGLIMSIGVAVANSILLVTFSERRRRAASPSLGLSQDQLIASAALDGAVSRLRPILMTSGSMLVGMMPMALGLGEGGQQTAPLGRAVIGGLMGSTVATLTILPMVFALIQRKGSLKSSSLHPEDLE